MDPLAHTLVGASLAEAGLKRLSRYATATLLIGANLPDVDGIASFWGRDVALHVRRGWSHGVLALVLLPLLLAGAVWLWHRWRSRRGDDGGPAFRLGAIIGLSYLAVWSHPLLDWLNTYGVRLLMPFDGRWFYGDTLFIIDPWLWLLAAAGVVLSRSRSLAGIAGWMVLAALTSALILSNGEVSTAVKMGWVGGVVLIAALRWRQHSAAGAQRVAQFSTAMLVIYVCAAYGLARVAETMAAERFVTPLQAQANPLPGTPLSHRVVLVFEDRYRILAADGQVHELPRREPDAVVKAALASPSVRGFANWMRFPYWRVEETATSHVVHLWDLRYQGPDLPPSARIGYARVELPKQGPAQP